MITIGTGVAEEQKVDTLHTVHTVCTSKRRPQGWIYCGVTKAIQGQHIARLCVCM